MVDYKPRPGESPTDHRARVQREVADEKGGVGAGPSADEQVEAAKAKVHADNAAKAQARVADPKNAVNRLDAAAATDDQVKAVHKNLAGGVKHVDASADAAFNADKSFQKKSAEEQSAVAKGAKPAHTTSTPGATKTPAVAAAMTAAGAAPKAEAPKAQPQRRVTITPDAATSARNNMGIPRGGDRGGVLGGVASNDSKSTLDAARAAAGRGSRNPSNRSAEESAARSSSHRSAASAPAPTRAPAQAEGLYGNQRRAEGFAHTLGLAGPSSKMSDKPAPSPVNKNVQQVDRSALPTVDRGTARQGPRYAQDLGTPVAAANPAPAAPAPVAPNSGGTAADRFTPRGSLNRASVGAGKPTLGKDITYGINAEKGPVANTRRAYQSHIAGGGNTESYWAERDAQKAGTAKPAPKAATVEPITPQAPKPAPASAPKAYTPQPAPPTPAAPRPMAGTPGPSRIPVPQSTPLAAPQMSKAAPAIPQAGPTAPPKTRAETPAPPVGPSGPASAPAPMAASPAPATGGGRSGLSTPRSPEVGGGRGGIHQGGEHNVNVGGDNHGNITHNHNTYNINHGVNNGSMGNVDHGYAPRGGGGVGRTPGGGGHAPAGHEPHFNLWVKDVNGTHDLHKTVQHVTGKTDGSGHPTTKAKRPAPGGSQQPINGSPRASGTAAPASTGTGTTHNWTGPIHTAPTSASGNGTANSTP